MGIGSKAARLGRWALELAGGSSDQVHKVVSPRHKPANSSSGYDDALYVDFMDAFRDVSAAEVAMRRYIPVLVEAGGGPVLDLGVGRGEFLRMLLAAGLDARGCENNAAEQSVSVASGLNVELAHATEYLSRFDDSSVAGITAIQVVEHLQPEYLLELLTLVGRKLCPGGVVILETPNMLNWLVQQNFWLDVSHVRPYPPDTLQFHLENAGLREFEFWYSSPQTQGVSACFDARRNYGDVTLVGRK